MRWSGGIVRRNDAAPGELFAGGIRRQEEADAARQIFGGDGAGGAVGPSGGTSATALPDWQARPTADRAGADAAALLRAAVVRAGRRGGGGCAVRQPGIARFCRHRSTVASVPDATTVLNFRHWLEQHDLTKVLFDEVGAMLEERGLLMRQGTIPAFAWTDATIIAAPPSTKNKSKARDPEMHQTKKGNQWHFGMPFDKLRSP